MLRLIGFLLLLPLNAYAITFVDGDRPDPFKEGAKCDHPELASSGSYVYQWPSKFDLVFEPWVSWFVTCPESGFASLAKDFGSLNTDEYDDIRSYLNEHPWRKQFEERENLNPLLDHIEAIYARRSLSDQDKAYFLRARAWHFGADARADAYRRRALEIHEALIDNASTKELALIESLYLAGFYNWKLGDRVRAEEFFDRTLEVTWTDADGELVVGSPYIEELIAEIKSGKADDAVRFAD